VLYVVARGLIGHGRRLSSRVDREKDPLSVILYRRLNDRLNLRDWKLISCVAHYLAGEIIETIALSREKRRRRKISRNCAIAGSIVIVDRT